MPCCSSEDGPSGAYNEIMRIGIKSIEVRTHRFDPAEAELTVTVVPEAVVPDLALRGRLMGPRCRFAETVEVAYPLRTLPGPGDVLRARVIIPEASFWEPITPFLYEGPVELWHAGQRVDRVQVTHGMARLTLGPRGLRLNGHAIILRVAVRSHLTDVESADLRKAKCDCVLTDTLLPGPFLREADQTGFLVLRRVGADHQLSVEAIRACTAHPSFAGWVIRAAAISAAVEAAIAPLRQYSAGLIGWEIAKPVETGNLERVDFVFGEERWLRDLPLPKLVRGEGGGDGVIGRLVS